MEDVGRRVDGTDWTPAMLMRLTNNSRAVGAGDLIPSHYSVDKGVFPAPW